MKATDRIVYTVECLPEYDPIEGNFASGDDEQDRETCQHIREMLDRTPWAWCCVKVTASIPGIELKGTDYLGACSYESEEDFKAGGYFEQMKEQAASELMEQLEAVREVLAA